MKCYTAGCQRAAASTPRGLLLAFCDRHFSLTMTAAFGRPEGRAGNGTSPRSRGQSARPSGRLNTPPPVLVVGVRAAG